MDSITVQEIDTLWQSFTAQQDEGEQTLDLSHLQAACADYGLKIDSHQLKNMFGILPEGESISREQFVAVMAGILGDRSTRIQHAFEYLDKDNDGVVGTESFIKVARTFAGEDPRCEQLAAELDTNGDSLITEKDFLNYLPDDYKPHEDSYRTTHLSSIEQRSSDTAASRKQDETPGKAQAGSGNATETSLTGIAGTSPLQLRIGFFRLLQGAAYRSFRENWSANSETHLRARDLPYSITDFARFVSATIDFYLGLGVIEAGCEPEFRKLDTMVQKQIQALHERIANWQNIDKTQAMLAAQEHIDTERNEREDHRHLFMAIVEYILSLQSNGLGFEHLAEDILAHHETNRLRNQELGQELADGSRQGSGQDGGIAYLDSWTRVIMDESDEKVDGAIMPVRFWYEEFMPQLLRCASITTTSELKALDAESAADLDQWFSTVRGTGVLDQFATDLRDGFAGNTRGTKQALKQAWNLTELYLNGVQKRREREEMGRGSGFLSEYVAFIDCFLGRNDIEIAEMRLSFPYYIGPAVWRLMHTSAELVEAMPLSERRQAVQRFKTFFATFATMYPCPYCRFHLNRYVVQNREVGMYPVEYLFLGQRPRADDLHVSINDKLASVDPEQPGSMRLFIWKLHNTVSSSIARSEPWFQRDPRPHYTTRYWPSMDSELARAHAMGKTTLELDRLTGIYGVLKPAARLSVLRDELQGALHSNDQAEIDRLYDKAQNVIADLEAEITASNWLQTHYRFDPSLVNVPPHFTDEEEAFARSGVFVEE